jgi:protein TonB
MPSLTFCHHRFQRRAAAIHAIIPSDRHSWEDAMQTLQTIHGVAPVRKQGKFISVALVGSLHIAVIYTLLVALEIVPSPVAPPTPPILARVLDQTKTMPQPLPHPMRGVVLTHPTAPNPTPPPIVIQNVPNGPTAIRPNTTVTAPVTPVLPASGPTLAVRPLSATHTIPPYPPMAVRLGYEGNVRLRIAVDERGNVVSADVLSSSGHTDLDEAAIGWVKTHWRYEPARQNGTAVPATTNAVVTFRLNQLHG